MNTLHIGATRTGAAGEMVRFADWCAVRRMTAMPASPATVLAYLESEQPGGRTAARWAAAIRAAHEAAGVRDPCRGSVAMWVRSRRRSGSLPERERGALLARLAGQLPETGWPCGLPGRRDRLAFLLSELGAIPAATLVRLPAAAVMVTAPRAVQVEHNGRAIAVLASPGTGPMACPACAALRWAWVLRLSDTFDRRRVADILAHSAPEPGHACERASDGAGEWPDRWPLFPPCDQWGYFPAPPVPAMSLRAMEGTLRAVRAGTAAYREAPPPRRGPDPADRPPPAPEPAPEPAATDPRWREAGLAARAAGREALASVEALLDELEARTTEAADRAQQVLGDALGGR